MQSPKGNHQYPNPDNGEPLCAREVMMKSGASLMERFDHWFVEPIEILKKMPEAGGAFLIVSTASFLCERYYRALTDTLYGKKDYETFKIEAAKDFGLSLDDFNRLWIVYRHGVQHQGTPQVYFDKKNKIKYTWLITDEINEIIEIHKINASEQEIRLDVWKFADFIINKFKTNTEVFQKAISPTLFPVIK
jgi:hypothetical protein